ncbi:uncharacterized protein ACDP82_019144 isoform 1-T1 [Pangshura tecta]
MAGNMRIMVTGVCLLLLCPGRDSCMFRPSTNPGSVLFHGASERHLGENHRCRHPLQGVVGGGTGPLLRDLEKPGSRPRHCSFHPSSRGSARGHYGSRIPPGVPVGELPWG